MDQPDAVFQVPCVAFHLHCNESGYPTHVSWECSECGQGGASVSLQKSRDDADIHMAIVHRMTPGGGTRVLFNPYFGAKLEETPPAPRPGAGGKLRP